MSVVRDVSVSAEPDVMAGRLSDPFSIPFSEFWAAELFGYVGYFVRWLTPDNAQFLSNFAGSFPDKQKLVHTHPGKDSIIVFLEGEADFLIGGQQRIKARPGDVLLSPGGRPHGMQNTGVNVCRWIYMEGPLPLTTEFPTCECTLYPLADPENPITGGAVGSFGRSGNSNIFASGGPVTRSEVAWQDKEPGDWLVEPGLFPALSSEVTGRLFDRVPGRTFSALDVKDQVRIGAGFSSRVHIPAYEHAQLAVVTHTVTGELPLHRYSGADQVVVMLDGQAEFSWIGSDDGSVERREFHSGMVGFVVNGESYGVRNLGDRPARLLSVVGPVTPDNSAIIWPRGEQPGDCATES
ncbi:cupin domain-containing protein [Mycolicibacterium sp. 624]|uniref:cupin domain-containing protein n=1 Tax=Mycolicibacterium sp. 624 TaxID=3156314 RepID=UPI0033924B76